MNYHLAILDKHWIEPIFDSTKTIESRFSKIRCAPFGKVHAGDVVYLKEACGLVKGMFKCARVETFENLTAGQICDLFYKGYKEQIFSGVSETYHHPPKKWLTAKHATLIHIANPVKFENPFQIVKKHGDAHAWKVLDHPLHLCVACEEPFLVGVIEGPDGVPLICSEDYCSTCDARMCVSPDDELAMED